MFQVSPAVNRSRWNEERYEGFIDELCGSREYQKDAIRTTLRYLLGGEYADLRQLAKENFDTNANLVARYGSWMNFQRNLQLPDQLSASLDLATGTGKSYVLYGIAAILLAEGAADRVLVLCPSNTIELGLLEKFRELASNTDLKALLPQDAKISTPRIIDASETIVSGSICVENYHAILQHVGSSIRDSLSGKGAKVAVLNDEAHHVANESETKVKRWKEFLLDPTFGFRYVIGVSGTCYIGNDYFSDVIYRYSLRQAMEQRFVKKVAYVAEMPRTGERNSKWQLIRNRHEDTRRKLHHRNIRPLTIVVTKTISRCKDLADELKAFLMEELGIDSKEADEQVLVVYNNAPDVRRLPYVDDEASKVEWVVAVSMLNEGWDVKRVFQIVPHEERAFNSKLLIAQVLGRGLRIPNGWHGEQAEVTVFNHDAWASRIRHLINEILELERRLSSRVWTDSDYHFELHNIDYTFAPSIVEKPMEREYVLFEKEYVDLASESSSEDVSIEFERADSGETFRWQTNIRRRTYSAREIAEVLYGRLEEADNPDLLEPDALKTNYTQLWPVERLEQIVRNSLAEIGASEVTEGMRQRLLQSLGTLRRKSTQNVRYFPIVDQNYVLSTRERPADSVSAAELRSIKTLFYTNRTRDALEDEQKEFFDEVVEPGGGFKTVAFDNRYDFKTPLSLVIADSENERKFLLNLRNPSNVVHIDAWIKSTATRFYEIAYAWKKGNTPKRGKFSPDFFIKVGDVMLVVEIKSDEELREPSEESRKKNEYALAHFERINRHLEELGSSLRYRFHFLSPKSFNVFFQQIREGNIGVFRSDLDVKLGEEEVV